MQNFIKIEVVKRLEKLIPASQFLLMFLGSRKVLLDSISNSKTKILATWLTTFTLSSSCKLISNSYPISSSLSFYLILRSVLPKKKLLTWQYLLPYFFLFIGTYIHRGKYIDRSFKSKLDTFIDSNEEKVAANNFKCNPHEYHPGLTCSQAFRLRSLNNFKFCLKFYPSVYVSMGTLRVLLFGLPLKSFPNWILIHCLRSLAYAQGSSLACTTYPCINRKLDLDKFGSRTELVFRNCYWLLAGFPVISLENPEQQVPILIFTASSLLFAHLRKLLEYLKIKEESLSPFLLATLFALWCSKLGKEGKNSLDRKVFKFLLTA